jgi:hypothetical protein
MSRTVPAKQSLQSCQYVRWAQRTSTLKWITVTSFREQYCQPISTALSKGPFEQAIEACRLNAFVATVPVAGAHCATVTCRQVHSFVLHSGAANRMRVSLEKYRKTNTLL